MVSRIQVPQPETAEDRTRSKYVDIQKHTMLANTGIFPTNEKNAGQNQKKLLF